MKIVRVTLTMAYPDNPTYELTEIVERVANCVADRLDAYALNIEASDRQVNFPDMTEEEENQRVATKAEKAEEKLEDEREKELEKKKMEKKKSELL